MPTDAEAIPTGSAGTLAGDVLLDTSAAIALVVADHEAHARAVDATRGRRLGLSGHAWFESCSVLTRMTAGIRRSPADVLRLLDHDFPATRWLDEAAQSALPAELARLRISGGAVYDALVRATARHHDRMLLTCDRRALRTHDALGVRFGLIE